MFRKQRADPAQTKCRRPGEGLPGWITVTTCVDGTSAACTVGAQSRHEITVHNDSPILHSFQVHASCTSEISYDQNGRREQKWAPNEMFIYGADERLVSCDLRPVGGPTQDATIELEMTWKAVNAPGGGEMVPVKLQVDTKP